MTSHGTRLGSGKVEENYAKKAAEAEHAETSKGKSRKIHQGDGQGIAREK